MIREQNQFESERAQLHERAEDAFRRLKRLESDDESGKSDRLALINRISTLEHDFKNVSEQKTKAQMQHESQFASLTQKYEGQLSDITTKLEIVSEAHSRTCHEMQQLLSDQRRLSEKWLNLNNTRKEESVQMKDHYEQVVSKTKSDMEQYRIRIGELDIQITKSTAQRKEMVEQVTNEKKEKGVLHARYINAEQRVDRLSRQIGILVSKETEMIENIKRLRKLLIKHRTRT